MGPQSQTIGPYTLEKRLGAGGMGEVYQAYDRRLDRWVAIKLIRPEHMENATARERFRREARAAARLSHPSIVQIYDIVESEESDAIVLELVEGEPLSRRIERGPLPVEEAVRLGRQIAEGLAAAHARGILHRDLKPENVMVTAEGHAKILDFGLAKRLDGEASLTEDHRVIGTFRSMSPEQARGLPLDHRSDLFSFGILLYEMLSGKSPFEGGSTLETLTRICGHRQKSLKVIMPSTPGSLSELVDHLLEKDPALRPRNSPVEELKSLDSVAAVRSDNRSTQVDLLYGTGRQGMAAAISLGDIAPPSPVALKKGFGSSVFWYVVGASICVTLLFSFWMVRREVQKGGKPSYVAVMEPDLVVKDSGPPYDLVAFGLRTALMQGLLDMEGLLPLAPEQVDRIAGSVQEVAKATAADEVVTSKLVCSRNACEVALRRIRGTDGSLIWTYSFTVSAGDPFLLSEVAVSQLKAGFPERRARVGENSFEVRPADYSEYVRLRYSFEIEKGEKVPLDQILVRLRRVQQGSPGFLEALILEANVRRYRFRAKRDSSDLEKSFEALAKAKILSPKDPRPLMNIVDIALVAGQLDRAEGALRELERSWPGDPGVVLQKAKILERRGSGDKALDLMRAAVDQRPSWSYLLQLASMEYRLGKVDSARHDLEKLLKLAPDLHDAQTLLAQLELLSGDSRSAVSLYASLVTRNPQFTELVNLGVAYMLLGSYPEAEASFARAYQLEPKNPLVTLNLGDVLTLLGRRREAQGFYEKTVELIAQDPASSDMQITTTRAQALAHLGRDHEAIEAVQPLLSAARENPQAAYEVSLVYVLVGDNASARVTAERALNGGIAAKWFSFPWFAPLVRTQPEFGALLRRKDPAFRLALQGV